MQIERKERLSQKEFTEMYLAANKPLIVSTALEGWEILWSPKVWKSKFGTKLAQVYNDLFELIDVMALGSYIDRYMSEGPTASKSRVDLPYIRWYGKMKDVDFVWADEVFSEISSKWFLPAFLPTSNYLLPSTGNSELDPATTPLPGKGLFISGKGARTRLHKDPWGSDAILCQLFGNKQIVLYDPTREPYLVRKGVTFDIDKPDFIIFPELLDVEPTAEGMLNPGELLFIPHGWYHHVTSVSNSISLTWNFVHTTTWRSFFLYILSESAKQELDVLTYFANLPG